MACLLFLFHTYVVRQGIFRVPETRRARTPAFIFNFRARFRDSALFRHSHAEEKAYWDTGGKVPEQQHCLPPPTSSSTTTTDQGLLSKLSGIEIGTAYGNLAKNLGGQAKNFGDQAKCLGDQAKTFGEQAKGYTVANTSTAAAAMNRFKKQIVAAVDGVPLRPDENQLRESGTTTAAKEKAEYDDEENRGLLLQELEEGGEHQDAEEAGKEEEGGDGGAAALKILPKTASSVGGKQWAVLASVYDTTASIVDETVGDLFT